MANESRHLAPLPGLLALVFCSVLWCGCASPNWYPYKAWPPFAKKETGPHVASPKERIEQLRAVAKRAPELSSDEQQKLSAQLAERLKKEDDVLMRMEMFKVLAALQTPTASSALFGGLQDSDPDIRVVCCEAWGRRGGNDAAQVLADVYSKETNLDVRLAALRALGATKDPAVVQSLGLALEDPDPAVEWQAVQSLRNVTGRDFGNDVAAWREFVATGNVTSGKETMASRIRQWF